MKKGAIIRNHWASEKNPGRYFIYIGKFGEYVKGITVHEGKLENVDYYKNDFDKTNDLGERIFEEVGYSKGFDILKSDLEKHIEGGR